MVNLEPQSVIRRRPLSYDVRERPRAPIRAPSSRALSSWHAPPSFDDIDDIDVGHFFEHLISRLASSASPTTSAS